MDHTRASPVTPADVRANRHDPSRNSTLQLVEVWGDTVDLRHLAGSVFLGAGISLGAFFAGQRLLSAFVADAAIARAYAMLVGLAGCLIAGTVCAFLFKPKREVVEHAVDETERMKVLDQLAAESGGLGNVADLPPSVRAEMAELGLLDLFVAYEKAHRKDLDTEPVADPARVPVRQGAHR